MKRGILSDPVQRKPEMAFFKVIFSFQMTDLEVLYEQDEIWKFHKQLFYLQTNTWRP